MMDEFVEGIFISVREGVASLALPSVRRFYQKNVLFLLLTLAGVATLSVLLLLPVLMLAQLALTAARALVSSEVPPSLSVGGVLHAWLGFLVFLVPLLGLFVIRYARAKDATEKIFFDALGRVDPAFTVELRRRPPRSFADNLYRFARRTAVFVAAALLVRLLGSVPFVGLYLVLLAQFYLIYTSLGLKRAIPIALLSLIPGSHAYIPFFVRFWLASRAITNELLDPYFSRLTPVELKATKIAWARHFDAEVVGFGLPLTAMLSLPMFGLLAWGPAQAAAAVLLHRLHEKQAQLESQQKLG